MILMAVLVLVLAGCATKPSPYASDPRCIGINQNNLYPWLGPVPGPTYMDYVMKYPRDRDTQLHHPRIYLDGQRVSTLNVAPAPTNAPPEIAALLTPVPPARLK